MKLIREIVEQAIRTGYLTLEAEEKLRTMLKNKYEFKKFFLINSCDPIHKNNLLFEYG